MTTMLKERPLGFRVENAYMILNWLGYGMSSNISVGAMSVRKYFSFVAFFKVCSLTQAASTERSEGVIAEGAGGMTRGAFREER